MSEKPILFSGPMVRAILNGTKTMTRRCHIKPQSPEGYQYVGHDPDFPDATEYHLWVSDVRPKRGLRHCVKLPYRVGDLAYAKETFSHVPVGESDEMGYIYKADGDSAFDRMTEGWDFMGKWTSSRFMPKEAARLWLKVTGVRVEQLQEIDPDDAVAEGIVQRWTCLNPGTGSYAHDNNVIDDFRVLWDSLNGKKPGFAWADNPWVPVYEFERAENE